MMPNLFHASTWWDMLTGVGQRVSDNTTAFTEKAQTTWTSAVLAVSKETHRYRRVVEDTHLLLKVDFQLATRCQDLQQNLKNLITDPKRFSSQWIAYFEPSHWTIHERDPQTVVCIKTMMQHLQQVQENFQRIEAMTFDPNTLDVVVMGQFLKEVTSLTHTLAHGMESLNRDVPYLGQAFHSVIQPLLTTGYQCISAMSQHQGLLEPTLIREHIDQFQQRIATKEPGLPQISAFLYHLPGYFKQIQQQLDPSEHTTMADDSTMAEKADELAKYLQDYLSQSGLTAFKAYLGGLGLLSQHMFDLADSGVLLTDSAYQKLLATVEQMQTQWLPRLIIEFETLEENLALKPNLLVGPLLEQLQNSHTALQPIFAAATSALKLQKKGSKKFNRLLPLQNLLFGPARALPLPQPQKIAGLNERLNTQPWMATVLEQRMQRLAQTATEVEDTAVLHAAKQFLALTTQLGQGVRVSRVQAEELRRLYRFIQPYYVALYPQLDIQFVEHFFQWIEWSPEKHQEIGQKVIDLIERYCYQAKFKSDCIQQCNQARQVLWQERYGVVSDHKPLDEASNFYYVKQQYQISQNKQRLEKQEEPLLAKGRELKHQPLIAQIQSLKLSLSLQVWIDQKLTPWLKDYLEPEFFSQLIFDKNSIHRDLAALTVLSHDKAAPVKTLQRFIYAILTLQKNLAGLENLPPSLLSEDPFDQLNLVLQQSAVLQKEWPVLAEQIEYIQYYLVEMQCYPAGKALLASFKHCFQKIKAQALFFSTTPEVSFVADAQPKSMLLLWQEQQTLRQAALTGTYQPPENVVSTDLSPKETLLQQLKIWVDKHCVTHATFWVTQIEEIVTDALSMGFNPLPLGAWLQKLDGFLKNVHAAGVDSQEQSWQIFHQLQTSVTAELLVLADDAEFQMGLLSGVISKPLQARLQCWMAQGLKALPTISQEAIKLWSYDTSVEAIRLQHQEKRLLQVEEENQHRLQTLTENIEQAYQLLQQNPLSQADFLQAYEWLQPALNQLHPRYGKIYFLRNSLVTPQDFVEEQTKMVALQPAVLHWLAQQDIHGVAAQKRVKNHLEKSHAQFLSYTQGQHQALKDYQKQCFDTVVHEIELLWISERAAEQVELFLPTITHWNQQLLTRFQHETTPQALLINKPMKEQLRALYQQYDDLMTVHAHLENIKHYIQKNPSADAGLDSRKQGLIESMQNDLLQTEEAPQQRLWRVVAMGLAEDTQQVLKRNADNPLLALLYCLLRFLFKWQSQQEKLATNLTNQLTLFQSKAAEEHSSLNLDGIPQPKSS